MPRVMHRAFNFRIPLNKPYSLSNPRRRSSIWQSTPICTCTTYQTWPGQSSLSLDLFTACRLLHARPLVSYLRKASSTYSGAWEVCSRTRSHFNSHPHFVLPALPPKLSHRCSLSVSTLLSVSFLLVLFSLFSPPFPLHPLRSTHKFFRHSSLLAPLSFALSIRSAFSPCFFSPAPTVTRPTHR